MQIKSTAGDFGFDIESIGIAGDDLILIGKMGVWEATTHVSQSDLIKLLRLILTDFRVWAHLLRLPLVLVRRNNTQKTEGENK